MSLLFKLCSRKQIKVEELRELRAALARGEDVNGRDAHNRTVLMYAARQCSENDVSIMRLLFEQPSIEVNLADGNGRTALHLATLGGRCEAVRLLLADARVDVNIRDNAGTTALHAATTNRNMDVVKLLLSHPRVDVNCKNGDQVTPLITAALQFEGNINIFKLLLAQQSVDVNYVAPNLVYGTGGITALSVASCHSNLEATKLLLDDPRVDVNWVDSSGLSVLHRLLDCPMDKSEVKILELFLAHPRVDVNSKYSGASILVPAAFYNNAEVVKLILDEPRFTSANVVDDKGGTAVTAAMFNGKWDALKELVHHPSVDLGVNLDDLAR